MGNEENRPDPGETGDRLRRELKQLYDDYRTALLNVKYYVRRLVFFKRVNFWMEIVVAVSSSTAIAAWPYWETAYGHSVWIFFGSLAAVVAVLKPVLQLPKAIERYQGLFGKYQAIYFDLSDCVRLVEVDHLFDENRRAVWASAQKRFRELAPQDDPEAQLKKKVLEACMAEVNSQIPPGSLWIPPVEEQQADLQPPTTWPEPPGP